MAANAPASPPQTTALTPVDETNDRLAGIRILRFTAVFVTVGYAAYGLAAIPVIADSTNSMRTWWTALALVVIFVPGLSLGLVSWWVPARSVRILAAVAVAGFIVAVATWPIGWKGTEVNTTTGIWFSMFFGVTALTATIAFRARYAFVVLAVLAVASTAINHLIRPPELNDSVVPDLAWAIGFSLVFVAAGTMLSTTASLLDSTRAHARSASAAAAAAHARAAERSRFDALTHDSVMATLLLASRVGSSPELTQHARNAIADIERTASVDDDIAIAPAEVFRQIRSSIDLAHPAVVATVSHASPALSPVPRTVVAAVSAATAEAVRNSRLHAGSDAVTTVDVTLHDAALTVRIVDDGVGFDPSSVPDARFGISGSIRGRMAKTPGCRADVDSAPGTGTRITLEWRA
ncbi:ATP-binding protein [Gordonia sp. TBRC 11910]|uniref:ATP-binding protein n=1 Tax=Gordonia asplenii TaxID=2725283 RepID=A0A848L2Y1_9ACTN|nr:ATP-binding protein [Gordonia asplenii]NMO05089.1 ATP-binding protein [Gordonia asplenii]